MSDRDRPKTPPSPPSAPPAGKPGDKPSGSGRVQFDDRGQAVWEWSVKTGMFDRNADTARIRTLTEAPNELRLVDDPPPPRDDQDSAPARTGSTPAAVRPGAARPVQPKPVALPDRSGGFNPYERVQAERPATKPRDSAGGDPYSRGPAKRPEDLSFDPHRPRPGQKK